MMIFPLCWADILSALFQFLPTYTNLVQTEQASVVFLKGVGTTMLGSDISRLLPPEASLPGFGKFLGILRSMGYSSPFLIPLSIFNGW